MRLGRLLILLVVMPFVTCVAWRDTITRPGVQVAVVDAAGAPVPAAEVVIHWWSLPHDQHHGTHVFTADASGVVVTTEQQKEERVAPLCMHGVPQHRYTLCVGAPGKGWTAVEIPGRPDAPVVVSLPGGAYAGECADFDRASRAARFGPPPADAGTSAP